MKTMELDRLTGLAKKIAQQGKNIETEEATKNAFIMPFLQSVLGYDVFDPDEVVPEYTADSGIKKGEKVDYAIIKDGEVQIIIECKKYGEKLSSGHAGQLFRYFSVTNARIAILTNGAQYQFFTDLEAPNKMDERPFLVLDLESIDEHVLPELAKLTKSTFDVDSVIDAAGELKYMSLIKKELAKQLDEPDEDFVRFFASKIYDGKVTQKVREQFAELLPKAISQQIGDMINARLKKALSNGDVPSPTIETAQTTETPASEKPENAPEEDSKIVTTEEELEGFQVIKAIAREVLPAERITFRDTQSYFGILADDNNRRPICRLHFNAKQWYVGIVDEDRKETRHPIKSIDDIYEFKADILEAASRYVEA